MVQGAYGLTTQPLVGLALMQTIVQGILIPMLANFLTTKSNHQPWFKIYVVAINILTLGQTIIHIIQAFDIINLLPQNIVLATTAPVLTGLIGAAVQPFFIYRCWRIYRQRVLATIPLLFLWLVSFVSGISISAFLAQSPSLRPDNWTPEENITILIWVVSSLLFDLITTSTTIIYMCRAHPVLGGNRSVFVVVWNIIWASAAPPFALMSIVLIDRYIIPNSPGVVGAIATAMTAKFFILSLMINIVGQGYIRQQFARTFPSPPGNPQSSQSQNDRLSKPVIGSMTTHTFDIELLARPGPGVVGSGDDPLNRYHSDDVSVKSQEGNLSHPVYTIQLDSKPAS